MVMTARAVNLSKVNNQHPYREITTTSDGSKTLFVPHWDEHYHSIHGAMQESLHVFIQAGLKYYIEKYQPDAIHIFEAGFGTGLNAFLTAKAVKDLPVKIHYQSIEAYPLTMEEVMALNYVEAESGELQNLYLDLHRTDWDRSVQITDNFVLEKQRGFLEEWEPSVPVDIVYFDAFAPSAQPDLWTEDIFRKLYTAMSERGILVTYCAKGSVKRAMKSVGWNIEKIPGPPGKREMTRAFV